MFENDYAVLRRAPDFFGGISPEHNPSQTQGPGEVRDAGIVADEGVARLDQARQFGQWEALRDFRAGDGQGGGEPLQSFAFGFAADQEQVEIRVLDEMLEQASPFVFRPIFLFAAAAGMERERGYWRDVRVAIRRCRDF